MGWSGDWHLDLCRMGEKAHKTWSLMGKKVLRLRWELPGTSCVRMCVCARVCLSVLWWKASEMSLGPLGGIWWFWTPEARQLPLMSASWASYALSNLPEGKEGEFYTWVRKDNYHDKHISPPHSICLRWLPSLVCSLQVVTVHCSGQRFAITHSNSPLPGGDFSKWLCGLWPPPGRADFEHICWEQLPVWTHSTPPQFVYFSLDLSYLDNSTTFILWYLKLPSGGLTLSPVPFRKRWALVVTDEQLFPCTVCYSGQKSFGDLNNV